MILSTLVLTVIVRPLQALIERRQPDDEHQNNNFPCTASPVAYSYPSLTDLAEKAAEFDNKSSSLQRKTSIVQRKGYTSDEDFDDLDDPFASIIDRTPVSPVMPGDNKTLQNSFSSVRYKLLREVWCE